MVSLLHLYIQINRNYTAHSAAHKDWCTESERYDIIPTMAKKTTTPKTTATQPVDEHAGHDHAGHDHSDHDHNHGDNIVQPNSKITVTVAWAKVQPVYDRVLKK